MFIKSLRQQLLDAEGGAGSTGGNGGEPQGGNGGTSGEGATSFDEMLKNSEYQAEFDKRTAKAIDTALANARKQWETDSKNQLEEAKKLAKMNAEEKAKYEKEKKEAEWAKREAEITKRELTLEAKDILIEKKLPTALSACLDYTSADSCKASIEVIEKAFNTAVEDHVNAKLRGKDMETGANNKSLSGVEARFMELNPNLK